MNGQQPTISRRSWPRRLLNRLEVDQAVFYALVVRGWQFIAGPITLLLIASRFTPDVQGYFYTFSSLLALQSFVELGLQGAIVYLASHEWAKLSLNERGQIVGDANSLLRLVSLGQFAFKFFAAAGLLFAVAVGVAGYVFFSQQPARGVDWVAPWMALVVLTGASVALIPCSALLRGCHQVAVVNRFQMVQAITGNLAIWACIVLGLDLWSAVAVAAVKLCWDAAIAFVAFPQFFEPFRKGVAEGAFKWRDEIWPLQWRLAVGGVFGYFATSIFTPVMFHYHGPATAGQMGMTWSALIALQFSAIAWVSTRAPRLGTLVSQGHVAELDRVFQRVTVVSFLLLALGGALFIGFVWLVNAFAGQPSWMPQLSEGTREFVAKLASRMLPLWPTTLLTMGIVLNHIPMSLSIYVRAHKVDPLVSWYAISSTAIGLLAWLLGSRLGPTGAAWGYLGVVALMSVPGACFIFQRFRRAQAAARAGTAPLRERGNLP